MNKKTRFGVIIAVVTVVLIILASIGIYFFIGVKQQTFVSSFTPVYCNQYEFSCCNDVKDYDQPFTLSLKDALICPPTATKCIINPSNWNIGGGYQRALSYGSTNCQYSCSLWVFCGWGCNDKTKANSFPLTLRPGQTIWYGEDSVGKVSINNEVHKDQLSFCGRSACSGAGIGVSSSNCVLTENKGTIYTKNGQNVGLSYTVPSTPGDNCILSWHSGDRTICGNLEEQCSQDSDCVGHTYGNQECTGRTLQTYGCKQLQLPNGVSNSGGQLVGADIIPGVSSPSYSGAKSRCEIISATTTGIDCCGDTDCGSNMFCDTNPSSQTAWKCKTKVSCNNDYDCGVSQQCDYSTNKLKTPKCSNGQCSYKEDTVDCCKDVNCPVGYTCTSEHKCQEKIVVKIACPFECCDKETNYLDRPCPTDKPYCVKNACSTNKPPVQGECQGHWYYLWLDALFCQINIWLTTFKWIFAIVLGFLGGIIGTGFVNRFIKDLKIKDKIRRILYLISFLIFGLAVGLIALFYFWVVLIMMIISVVGLVLIKIFIPI